MNGPRVVADHRRALAPALRRPIRRWWAAPSRSTASTTRWSASSRATSGCCCRPRLSWSRTPSSGPRCSTTTPTHRRETSPGFTVFGRLADGAHLGAGAGRDGSHRRAAPLGAPGPRGVQPADPGRPAAPGRRQACPAGAAGPHGRGGAGAADRLRQRGEPAADPGHRARAASWRSARRSGATRGAMVRQLLAESAVMRAGRRAPSAWRSRSGPWCCSEGSVPRTCRGWRTSGWTAPCSASPSRCRWPPCSSSASRRRSGPRGWIRTPRLQQGSRGGGGRDRRRTRRPAGVRRGRPLGRAAGGRGACSTGAFSSCSRCAPASTRPTCSPSSSTLPAARYPNRAGAAAVLSRAGGAAAGRCRA